MVLLFLVLTRRRSWQANDTGIGVIVVVSKTETIWRRSVLDVMVTFLMVVSNVGAGAMICLFSELKVVHHDSW